MMGGSVNGVRPTPIIASTLTPQRADMQGGKVNLTLEPNKLLLQIVSD
jgi:hypothetical protein